MNKKYTQEAERLRRFIYSRWRTVDECADAVGVSADGLRTGYLSGRSLMGGDLLKRFAFSGLDPLYYLIGAGLAPDANEEELRQYIEQLEGQLDTLRSLLDAMEGARREILAKLPEQPFLKAAEPSTSYGRNRKRTK